MSDNFASSAALGYLAGSYSGAQTGKAVLALMSGLRERAAAGAAAVDVNALLQALQEQDHYINQQGAYVEALRREVAELRAHAAQVESDRDRLNEYGTWAEAELKKRSPNG